LKTTFLALAAVTLLAACESTDFYQNSTPPRWATATIQVTWLADNAAVTKKCQKLGLNTLGASGCARSRPDDIKICEIYAVKPRNFNDLYRLEVLGHEVLHCLGAKHD